MTDRLVYFRTVFIISPLNIQIEIVRTIRLRKYDFGINSGKQYLGDCELMWFNS